jgi:predicted PurR-regulated permease PerM
MFIILGGILFFFVALFTFLRTKKKRAVSTTTIICMLAAALGAILGAFFEMFLPLSQERIDDIQRTQTTCVLEALNKNSSTTTEMALLKAISACRDTDSAPGSGS